MFRHQSTAVHKQVQRLTKPDLPALEHLWDELERELSARPLHLTPVPELTSALIAE